MKNQNTINQVLSLSSVVATLLTTSKKLDGIYNITTTDKYGIITAVNTDINSAVRIIMPYCSASPKPRHISSNKLYIHFGSTVMSICSELEQLAPATLALICRALYIASLAVGQLSTHLLAATQIDSDLKQSVCNTLITSCEVLDKKLTEEVSLPLAVHNLLCLMVHCHPCLYGRHIHIPYYPVASATAASIAVHVADCILSHLQWLKSLAPNKTSSDFGETL